MTEGIINSAHSPGGTGSSLPLPILLSFPVPFLFGFGVAVAKRRYGWAALALLGATVAGWLALYLFVSAIV